MALVNATRNRTRTALAALGLTIGIAAFAALLAISFAFQGAIVGSILGDTIAIQTRTSDYVAVGAILVLASLGVANVLLLNIRDRGSELATLRALGWDNHLLDQLIIGEAMVIAAIGGTSGAVLGLGLARAIAGELTRSMTLAAAAAWLSAGLVCSAAGAVATFRLSRIPTTVLLAEG
jgi:ABC-type antimicrobial peptide transport system permease subunit